MIPKKLINEIIIIKNADKVSIEMITLPNNDDIGKDVSNSRPLYKTKIDGKIAVAPAMNVKIEQIFSLNSSFAKRTSIAPKSNIKTDKIKYSIIPQLV